MLCGIEKLFPIVNFQRWKLNRYQVHIKWKCLLSITDMINVVLIKLAKRDGNENLKRLKFTLSYIHTWNYICIATFLLISKVPHPLIIFPVRTVFPMYTLLMKPQFETLFSWHSCWFNTQLIALMQGFATWTTLVNLFCWKLWSHIFGKILSW